MDLGNGDPDLARGAGARSWRWAITHSRSAGRATLPITCVPSARRLRFAATVGDDAFAQQVRDLLRGEQVDDAGVFALSGRPTTRKTRVVAHNQQVVRADWESVAPPSAARARAGDAYVAASAARSDAVDLQRLRQRVDRRARSSRPRWMPAGTWSTRSRKTSTYLPA